MLSVEQVRSLDGKVRRALELIDKLKKENSMLKGKLDEYRQRVDQLEGVVDGFKLEQLEIEEGIKDVLKQLDQLEDQITAPSSPSAVAENIKASSAEPAAASPVREIPVPAAAEKEFFGSTAAEFEEESEDFDDDQYEQRPPELEIF